MSDRSFLSPVSSNVDLDFESWLQHKHPELVSDFATQMGLMEPRSPMHSTALQMGLNSASAPQANAQLPGLPGLPQPPIPGMSLPQLMNMVRGQRQQVQITGPGLMAPQNPFNTSWGLMEG